MRRLGNIFKADGKTVIVAMDHGLGLDVLPRNEGCRRNNIIGSPRRCGCSALRIRHGQKV